MEQIKHNGKPINIIVGEMTRLKKEIDELNNAENEKNDIENKQDIIKNEINELNYQLNFYKELFSITEHEKIESEKIKYSENIIDSNESKIQELLEEKDLYSENKKTYKHQLKIEFNKKPYQISIIVLIFLAICSIIFSFITYKKIIGAIIASILFILAIFIFSVQKNKYKKSLKKNAEINKKMSDIDFENKELEKKIYEIDAQIELLEKNQKEQINLIEKRKNEILKKILDNKKEIFKKYDKMNSFPMNNNLSNKELTNEINILQNVINEKNIELHKLQFNKDQIMLKLDNFTQNQELFEEYKDKFDYLIKKNDAFNLVNQVLEEAYLKMKSDITPKFTKDLSKNMMKITNEKYKNVLINDDGILVELENGDYKNINRLSHGTIQQLYLSFRLSMIENISEENMPIILDEVFAYYDDKRIKEALKNIYEEYSKKHQIIIFTCTNREENALNDLNINYNKVLL